MYTGKAADDAQFERDNAELVKKLRSEAEVAQSLTAEQIQEKHRQTARQQEEKYRDNKETLDDKCKKVKIVDDKYRRRLNHRNSIIKAALAVLKKKRATFERPIKSDDLAEAVEVHKKGLSNYLTYAISHGKIAKVRRKANNKSRTKIDWWYIPSKKKETINE